MSFRLHLRMLPRREKIGEIPSRKWSKRCFRRRNGKGSTVITPSKVIVTTPGANNKKKFNGIGPINSIVTLGKRTL